MTRLLVMSHAAVLNVNRSLFESLADIAHVDITLVAPINWKGDLIRDLKFQNSNPRKNFKVIGLPVSLSGNGSFFFYRSSLHTLIKTVQPDFAFLDEEPWSLAAFQASHALKGIGFCFYTKQNIKKRLPFPFRIIEQAVFKRSSFALVISQEVSSVLDWKRYKNKTHSLPHSYDPALFQILNPKDKAELRKSLNIPMNSIVVSYFGRLAEEKGILDLLNAMSSILSKPQFENIHFLCVGNGPLYNSIKTKCAQLPPHSITLLHALPHHLVGQTLAVSDILVLPSRTTPHWKEQFGRILIEAMGCGVAVIGSDSGEIPHLITQTNGGVIFPEGDQNLLEQRISELILNSSEMEKFKKKGYAYASAEFTHEKVAKKLATLLNIPLKK